MAEGQARSMQQVCEPGPRQASDWLSVQDQAGWPSDPLSPDRRRERLRQAVKAEILPRVSLNRAAWTPSDPIDSDAVQSLVALLLRATEPQIACESVEQLLAGGMSIEHIYLRLFQPAARRLGELWADDLCSFVDVTLGLATLQDLLRQLGPAFHCQGLGGDGRRSILLTTLPGDQHTFGVNMAGEFFRRAGWSVCSPVWHEADDLPPAIADGGCCAIGFSVGRDGRLDELAATIRSVRRTLKGRAVGILVGGPLFIAQPELAARVGADAVGVDARQALAQAEVFALQAEAR